MGFGKDGKGVIIHLDAGPTGLSTLASKAAVQVAALPVTEDFRALKIEAHWTGGAFTGDDDKVLLGIADGELSAAEIAECINADGPLDRNDNLTRERAERPVWLLEGILPSIDGGTTIVTGYAYTEWTKRWTFSNPEGLQFFVYNPDTDALTTGAGVSVTATIYGVWVT